MFVCEIARKRVHAHLIPLGQTNCEWNTIRHFCPTLTPPPQSPFTSSHPQQGPENLYGYNWWTVCTDWLSHQSSVHPCALLCLIWSFFCFPLNIHQKVSLHFSSVPLHSLHLLFYPSLSSSRVASFYIFIWLWHGVLWMLIGSHAHKVQYSD